MTGEIPLAPLAEIPVATRYHAMRNPEAVQAMNDLEFLDIRETSIDDVVNSRMIADPLHLLECCMISDGGGAVVIAAPDVAKDCAKPPVWILGSGEATKYPENGGDITSSAAVHLTFCAVHDNAFIVPFRNSLRF